MKNWDRKDANDILFGYHGAYDYIVPRGIAIGIRGVSYHEGIHTPAERAQAMQWCDSNGPLLERVAAFHTVKGDVWYGIIAPSTRPIAQLQDIRTEEGMLHGLVHVRSQPYLFLRDEFEKLERIIVAMDGIQRTTMMDFPLPEKNGYASSLQFAPVLLRALLDGKVVYEQSDVRPEPLPAAEPWRSPFFEMALRDD